MKTKQASEFANAYEYEQFKRQQRKADQSKRSSPQGRRSYSLKGSEE